MHWKVECGKEGLHMYWKYDFWDSRGVFEESVSYFPKAYFRVLPNALKSNTRNNSMNEVVSIQKWVNLKMSTTLANHFRTVSKEELQGPGHCSTRNRDEIIPRTLVIWWWIWDQYIKPTLRPDPGANVAWWAIQGKDMFLNLSCMTASTWELPEGQSAELHKSFSNACELRDIKTLKKSRACSYCLIWRFSNDRH